MTTIAGNRLDANPGAFWEADLRKLFGEVFFEQFDELGVGLGALFKFNPSIDIFSVLTEDHHFNFFGMLNGGRYTFEPAHRP